jgi:HSP20 family molecular chaperone IbpA
MADFTRPHPPEKGASVPSAGPADLTRGTSPERRLCAPPIDIYETDTGLVLCADLPGVTAEGLELQVQDNKLMLFGRVQTDVPPDAKRLHQEYHVCDFLRSFILSDEVDHERISAKINNGVLEVILPTAERPKPRRIEVRTD